MYQFPRAIVTNDQELRGLKIYLGSLFSHNSGDKSEIKVSTKLDPSVGSEGECIPHLSPSFWLLPAMLGVFWCVRCITPISASVYHME